MQVSPTNTNKTPKSQFYIKYNNLSTQPEQFYRFNNQKSNGQETNTNTHGFNSYPSIKFLTEGNQDNFVPIDQAGHDQPEVAFMVGQMSVTEKEILSHQIIHHIIEKSRKNTVQHNVNKIAPETRLYSVPQQHNPKQFQFDTIPPTNQHFASTTSNKVKQIHERLSNPKRLQQRLIQIAEKNKDKLSQSRQESKGKIMGQGKARGSVTGNKIRPQSAHNEYVDRRVSVSGLVTYSFNSVKARRSLGYIPDKTEEEALAIKVAQSKRIVNSGLDRFAKIIKRKPTMQNKKKMQMSKAIVCDFHTPTDKFLKSIKDQLDRDKQIYGQRMQKLTCIKQYMQKQKSSYQNSSKIVQTILKSQATNKTNNKVNSKIGNNKTQKSGRSRKTIDDDVELDKRMRVLQRKKIVLRHLYFTE